MQATQPFVPVAESFKASYHFLLDASAEYTEISITDRYDNAMYYLRTLLFDCDGVLDTFNSNNVKYCKMMKKLINLFVLCENYDEEQFYNYFDKSSRRQRSIEKDLQKLEKLVERVFIWIATVENLLTAAEREYLLNILKRVRQ